MITARERRVGTTRRQLLMGAAAAGLLTACSSTDADRHGPGESASVRAENTLRVRTAATSRSLLAQYDAVLARHPDQRATLAPLRAATAQHVAALSPARKPPATPPPSPTAAVSADPAEALRALATTARRTTDAQTAALVDAPPELARLLASVAAASATHAYLLTEGAAR
ncbi:hypothetical protein OHS57_27915 [Streptomyces sp. NBC_00370]